MKQIEQEKRYCCLNISLIFRTSFCNSYSYMIDNIILLITGTLHQRAISELIPKCHPLGSFEQMEAIHIASTPAELYNAVLVDTPLGNFICQFVIKKGIEITSNANHGFQSVNKQHGFFSSTVLHRLHFGTGLGWNEHWNHQEYVVQGKFVSRV